MKIHYAGSSNVYANWHGLGGVVGFSKNPVCRVEPAIDEVKASDRIPAVTCKRCLRWISRHRLEVKFRSLR